MIPLGGVAARISRSFLRNNDRRAITSVTPQLNIKEPCSRLHHPEPGIDRSEADPDRVVMRVSETLRGNQRYDEGNVTLGG
jgi:hypothetical protein